MRHEDLKHPFDDDLKIKMGCASTSSSDHFLRSSTLALFFHDCFAILFLIVQKKKNCDRVILNLVFNVAQYFCFDHILRSILTWWLKKIVFEDLMIFNFKSIIWMHSIQFFQTIFKHYLLTLGIKLEMKGNGVSRSKYSLAGRWSSRVVKKLL